MSLREHLTHLNLSSNQISDITSLKELKNIQTLDLYNNKIIDISPLKELINLQYLDLYYNRISNITPIENLTKMKILLLSINTIKDISPIKNMQQLEHVSFVKNYIRILPEWITEFPKLDIQWNRESKHGFITFFENPIKTPPIEIIKHGKAAIKQWFTQTIHNS